MDIYGGKKGGTVLYSIYKRVVSMLTKRWRQFSLKKRSRHFGWEQVKDNKTSEVVLIGTQCRF